MTISNGQTSARPLAWLYAALIVYASLYPFGPWRWPPGMTWPLPAQLPWPRYWPLFDVVSNVAGYVPLAFLLLTAGARHITWPRAMAAVLMGLVTRRGS